MKAGEIPQTMERLRNNQPFLVAYHLNGDELVVLVVQTFQDLPKGAFPNHFKYFKSVGNVVVQHLNKQRKDYFNHLNSTLLLKRQYIQNI